MKKKVTFFIIIMMLLFFSITFVDASSFEFIAKAQKDKYKPGEVVYIYMNIDKIDAGNLGINVVEMNLQYDENVFESMSFIKKNNWNFDYNNDKNSEKFGTVLFTNISSGVTEPECIAIVKLQLRSDLKDMETQIKLNGITSNDGKALIPEGDRVITIKIVNEGDIVQVEPEEPKDPQTPDAPDDSNNEVLQDGSKTPATSVTDTNNSINGQLLQTGQTRILYIIIGVIIVACIIALILFTVFKKKKDGED